MANHLISYLNEDGTESAATKSNGLPVHASNISTKFREAFETYDKTNVWSETLASGDIIMVDGNAAAASYLVISKDPFTAGSNSQIETITTFDMPFDLAIGASMSQRTLGQEFSIEVVSNETPLTPPEDIAIASISQATSTLSVTTSVAHNLRPGMRIGISGVSDSRFNYPSLVVATTPTDTTFTSTAGPGGNLPSVTAGPFTSGVVYSRSALGYAPNGASMIFENATATNASFFIRSESGDVLPSGTIATNHSVTMATTASVQAINAALTYAFQPTNEYRFSQFIDGIQWSDVLVDSLVASSSRYKRTQVVPDPSSKYKFRIRAKNNNALTVPVAHIQNVAKTGTTTATITTQTPHGLTTGDLIAAYGVRDFTNFANLTAATAVASVIDANNFTVIWGSAVTATSQGGIIYRVNGGNLPSTLGAIAQVAQSVTRTNNILTVVGSASWAGLLIGDYVNLAAFHDTGGVDLLLDGAYRIRDIQTTSLFLEPIGNAPTGTNIVTTNCGGAVVKRTDMRISFIRILDFDRERVEFLPRPQGDISSALSVNVQNTPAMTVSSGTVTTVSTVTSVGTAGVPPVPATSYFLNSAATTNGALIITGTSGVYSVYATNIGATNAFVKLYNKATAPTVGTDVPEMIIPVPAAVSGVPGVASIPLGYIGARFALGLGIAITGAMADNDTTAVAAGQVKVKLSRTV